jgi:beta-carotene 3-hydroxylase
MVHDGLVHQRWPFRYIPRRGYLKRLYMAHRLHHAVRGKEDCVSFGFLYAPPVSKLQAILRSRNGRPPQGEKATPRDRHAGDAATARKNAATSTRRES